MILEKNIDNNFFETINILNSNNINYWICHGTLLGIIRDGKLIEWDHDIDIAIWSDEIPKNLIIELMKKNNFKLRDGFGIDDVHADPVEQAISDILIIIFSAL